MNVLALCAGYGGLELGVHLATGGRSRAVCYVEREAFAAACLVAQMEAGHLAKAPVWSDVGTFDARPWRGRVDCVTAGFPCQPFSAAGKRKGTDDERWLWPEIARIVGECRPRLVYLENVPPLRGSGLRAVLGDLAGLGFDAQWTTLSAGACGGAHERNRLWIMAYAQRAGLATWGIARRKVSQLTGSQHGDRFVVRKVGHTDGQGQPQQGGPNGPQRGRAVACVDSPLWAAGPDTRPEDWPEDIPQPAVRRAPHGATSRVDELRLLGGGVVPVVAAHALVALAARAGVKL